MDTQNQIRIDIFDQVELYTTKNVTYVSAPPGTKLSPHGEWSVSAAIGSDLLVVRNSVIVRIPASDVLLVRKHNKSNILDHLGKLRHVKTTEGQRREEGSAEIPSGTPGVDQ
jgi:hypothetical protein